MECLPKGSLWRTARPPGLGRLETLTAGSGGGRPLCNALHKGREQPPDSVRLNPEFSSDASVRGFRAIRKSDSRPWRLLQTECRQRLLHQVAVISDLTRKRPRPIITQASGDARSWSRGVADLPWRRSRNKGGHYGEGKGTGNAGSPGVACSRGPVRRGPLPLCHGRWHRTVRIMPS